MREIPFNSLTEVLRRPAHYSKIGARLKIGTVPHPFVPPSFVSDASLGELFSVEVVFVQASAAVGKSTIANYLSGSLQLPLLDLATIPVSTGSLKALIQDISGEKSPLAEFHAGNLPIIIDALDEGRLRSGEAGFESFLQTTGELLLEDRSVTNRPKVIFFGRYESTDLAQMGLELVGGGITSSAVQVGFFGREGAWSLIRAYADAAAKPDSPYRQHPEPVQQVIQAYFEAIAAALGLADLWASEEGKAFAGYAPVLAAVGSLIAELDNFVDVANKLRAAGTHRAWDVIEAVLYQIIEREQRKFCEKLQTQMRGPMPAEAYDLHEQLTLLFQYVHRQPLAGSGRVKLSGADKAKYDAMVQQYVPEHPFVRQNEFGNAVLGSVVIAHAIANDLLRGSDLERTANLSGQPFIWRAIVQRLSTDSLVDGTYLGYLLNSFWNDPVRSERKTIIQSQDADAVLIRVPIGEHDYVEFSAIAPITFYAQVRDCDVDLANTLKLIGHGPRGSATIFVRGETAIICTQVEIISDSVRFDGSIWLESDAISAPPGLKVFIDGARIGWGGQFRQVYPWNTFQTNLPAPYHVQAQDELNALVRECESRLPPGVTLTLNPDFSPAEDDPQMRWVVRRYAASFPALVRILLKHEKASSQAMPAAGRGKVRIRFDFSWSEFSNALGAEHQGQWRAIIAEASAVINR